jgi:hypothetical protein
MLNINKSISDDKFGYLLSALCLSSSYMCRLRHSLTFY